MESPIHTVPELTKIVRVVGDHIPIKQRTSAIIISGDIRGAGDLICMDYTFKYLRVNCSFLNKHS